MKKNDSEGAPIGGGFTDGNPGGGIPATVLEAEFMNVLQDELVNLVEGAGLNLDPDDSTQALQAVQALTGSKTRKDDAINGAFQVWQRGVTFAVGNTWRYTADRWRARADAGGGAGTATVSRVAATPDELPVGAPFFLRFAQGVSASAGNPRLETVVEDVMRFGSVDRVYSVYLRATAAINVTLALIQTFGAGGSGDTTVATKVVSLSGAFQRFHIGAELPTVLGKTINPGSGLVLAIQFPSGSGFQVDVAAAQLEPGLAPSVFELRPRGDEEARCLRYYQQTYEPGTPPATVTNVGMRAVFNVAVADQLHPVGLLSPMRTVPTVTIYSPVTGDSGKVRNLRDSSEITIGAVVNASTRSGGLFPVPAPTGSASYFGFHATFEAEL